MAQGRMPTVRLFGSSPPPDGDDADNDNDNAAAVGHYSAAATAHNSLQQHEAAQQGQEEDDADSDGDERESTAPTPYASTHQGSHRDSNAAVGYGLYGHTQPFAYGAGLNSPLGLNTPFSPSLGSPTLGGMSFRPSLGLGLTPSGLGTHLTGQQPQRAGLGPARASDSSAGGSGGAPSRSPSFTYSTTPTTSPAPTAQGSRPSPSGSSPLVQSHPGERPPSPKRSRSSGAEGKAAAAGEEEAPVPGRATLSKATAAAAARLFGGNVRTATHTQHPPPQANSTNSAGSTPSTAPRRRALVGRRALHGVPPAFPTYARPAEVGAFSLNARREFLPSRAALRRMRPVAGDGVTRDTVRGGGTAAAPAPLKLGVDLEEGFARRVERDPNKREYLDHLLVFLRHARAHTDPAARGVRGATAAAAAATVKAGVGSGIATGKTSASGSAAATPATGTASQSQSAPPAATTAATAAAPASTPAVDYAKPFGCDVVCWRGLLTKIMVAATETRSSLRFAAARVGTAVYLCEFETAEHAAERQSENERERRTSYAGYRFESYATVDMDDKDEKSKTGASGQSGRSAQSAESLVPPPVNTNEAFCSVVSARLGKLRLLLGGEVDCEDQAGRYLELKTCFEHTRHRRGFTLYKSHKWWAQSFLLGIETLVCGLRSRDNHLLAVEHFPVHTLHKVDGERHWEPAASMQRLLLVLTTLIEAVKEENVVYVVDWDNDTATFYMHEERTHAAHAFFPAWMVTETGRNLSEVTRRGSDADGI